MGVQITVCGELYSLQTVVGVLYDLFRDDGAELVRLLKEKEAELVEDGD